jgi:hypothetical protein
VHLDASPAGVLVAGGDHLGGGVGDVERGVQLDALFAVRQGEQRLDEAFLLVVEREDLVARDRSVSAVASGSASATWSTVRSAVSGVRSSCEALATKCRCDANAACNRWNRGTMRKLAYRAGPRSR